MKKKILLALVVAAMCTIAIGVISVSASTEGIYTYSVGLGKVTIEKCDTSASGDIIIPDTLGGYPVITIDDYAFLGCTNIVSITIPDSVINIGENPFSNCNSLLNIIANDNPNYCSIDGVLFNKNKTVLVQYPTGKTQIEYIIPDSVTTIGKYAFGDCGGITTVTIPDSVTNIEESAFQGSGLTSIIIPDRITSISDNTFRSCYNLESITIPDSVISIGKYGFGFCKNLESITIPDSVTSIDEDAFGGCKSLARVDISDLSAWLKIKFGGSSSNPLVQAQNLYLNGSLVENLIVPEGITAIGDFAFSGCSSLVKVTIPDSVTAIGDSVFENCINIARITIPDSVTSIGEWAFWNCASFSSITIPDGITNIEDYAFGGCSSLKTITIPDSVISIGERAFAACDNLENVIVGNKVTTIGNYAFSECCSLTSITIPGSVTRIGELPFERCTSLTKVNISDVSAWCKIEFARWDSNPLYYAHNLYLNGNLVANLTIPDGVTRICAYAFEGCTSLASITIPSSVTNIDKYAFEGCYKLAGVDISDVSAWCKIEFSGPASHPLNYAHKLYLNGKLVENLVVPDDVTSIGSHAFYGCTSLVSATIGNGVEVISESAFYGSSLKYVSLPSKIEYIKNDAFNNCSNIEIVFYAGSEAEWNEILFYNRNENLTDAKIIYNATKKKYSFDTNCDTTLDDVTDYAIFTIPTVENNGTTFIGWYDNKELNGEPVSFPYYGEATTLYAAWVDRTGNSFDDAFIAKANQEHTVTTTENDQLVYFEFVPRLSKEYRFYTTGSTDTYGYLYDGSKSQLAYNNDDGDGNNFYISYNLTAGETYYIAAKINSGTGAFALVIEEPADYRINEITIKDMSGINLQSIPTGTFLATVSFTNVSASKDAVIVLAQYTTDGAFKGIMYIQTEDVPKGSTIKLSIPVDNSKGDIATLKAFCWESFGPSAPMAGSVTFPAQQ